MAHTVPALREGDPPQSRAKDGRWHHGLMITQERAAHVAALLFEDEIFEGIGFDRTDPANAPLLVAEEKWAARVRQVRLAMIAAFKAS